MTQETPIAPKGETVRVRVETLETLIEAVQYLNHPIDVSKPRRAEIDHAAADAAHALELLGYPGLIETTTTEVGDDA